MNVEIDRGKHGNIPQDKGMDKNFLNRIVIAQERTPIINKLRFKSMCTAKEAAFRKKNL